MREQIGGFFWLAISIFVCYESIKSDIGTLSAPGPGFLPFWSAAVLGLFAVALIIYSSVKPQLRLGIRDMWRGLHWGKVISMFCALFLYTLLLPKLGYVIATFVLVFFVTSVIDPSRLWRHGVSALITVASSYVLFNVLLDVKLPRGMFGF